MACRGWTGGEEGLGAGACCFARRHRLPEWNFAKFPGKTHGSEFEEIAPKIPEAFVRIKIALATARVKAEFKWFPVCFLEINLFLNDGCWIRLYQRQQWTLQ